jgi:tetratricopeptide (TPR) repeat protein
MPQDELVSAAEPKTPEDYFRQGWVQHSNENDERAAEGSFRRSISLDKNNVDAYFGLGLVQKAQGKHQEALDSFQTVLEKIAGGRIEDHVRAEMLRRLTLGHINLLKTGDWDLEKEIWQHKE